MNEASKPPERETEAQALDRLNRDLYFKRALCHLVLLGKLDADAAKWYYEALRVQGAA